MEVLKLTISNVYSIIMAGPGFPGTSNSKDGHKKLSFGQFVPKNCMKINEIQLGGGSQDGTANVDVLNCICWETFKGII